tara:strand:+ start:114 stop:965 length:852 start_codon:yes stop_codon:yes gene_type:complete
MFAVEYPIPCITSASNDLVQHEELSDICFMLQQNKERVRLKINTIGEKEWRKLVFQPDPPWNIKKKPVSRAYYKLWEMIKACVIPHYDTSVHLCEAPGGFLEACMDIFPLKFWKAYSLPGPIKFHYKFDASNVQYIDIISNQEDVIKSIQANFVHGVGFITADGATEFDHSKLEESSIPLVVAQVNIALKTLQKDGSFVIKVFELCTHDSRMILARLASSFQSVCLFKPTHSRPTNSEIYIVCRKFIADNSFAPSKVWYDAVMKTVDEICGKQSNALRDVLLK